jgi:hypothetical protein
MKVPFLNWLERIAYRILVRSRNTGLVVVKQMDGPWMLVASAPFDEMPITPGETVSEHLERMYRAPSRDSSYGPD